MRLKSRFSIILGQRRGKRMNTYFLSILKADRKRKEEDWDTQVFWVYTNRNGRYSRKKKRYDGYPHQLLSYLNTHEFIDLNRKVNLDKPHLRDQDLILGSQKPFILLDHEDEIARYNCGLFFPFPTFCIPFSHLKIKCQGENVIMRMRFIPDQDRRNCDPGFIFPGAKYWMREGMIVPRLAPSSVYEGYEVEMNRCFYL
jgi:hypothetical protein